MTDTYRYRSVRRATHAGFVRETSGRAPVFKTYGMPHDGLSRPRSRTHGGTPCTVRSHRSTAPYLLITVGMLLAEGWPSGKAPDLKSGDGESRGRFDSCTFRQ